MELETNPLITITARQVLKKNADWEFFFLKSIVKNQFKDFQKGDYEYEFSYHDIIHRLFLSEEEIPIRFKKLFKTQIHIAGLELMISLVMRLVVQEEEKRILVSLNPGLIDLLSGSFPLLQLKEE